MMQTKLTATEYIRYSSLASSSSSCSSLRLLALLTTSGFLGSLLLFLVGLDLADMGVDHRGVLSFALGGTLQEGVLQEVLGRGALLGVHCETGLHEVAEALGPAVADLGRISCDDIDHNTALRLTDVGRVTLGDLKGEDTERPDVNLGVVASLTLNELWRHPTESAHFRGTSRTFLRKLG